MTKEASTRLAELQRERALYVWCRPIYNILYHTQPNRFISQVLGVTSSWRQLWKMDYTLCCGNSIPGLDIFLNYLTDTNWVVLGFACHLSFMPNLCNSFEDSKPVDEIYGHPTFKWIAMTWLKDGAPGSRDQDSSSRDGCQGDLHHCLCTCPEWKMPCRPTVFDVIVYSLIRTNSIYQLKLDYLNLNQAYFYV